MLYTVINTIIRGFDVELQDPEGLLEHAQPHQRIRPHVYSFPISSVYATINARHHRLADVIKAVVASNQLLRTAAIVEGECEDDSADEADEPSNYDHVKAADGRG